MIKVGIIGATGYTGVELLRLLAAHPHAQVTTITSRQHHGSKACDLFPNLRGKYELRYQSPDESTLDDCDVVFSATPNGVAMRHADKLISQGKKFIDLSADFRLKDEKLWSKWYGLTHASPELLSSAVYGLPEVNRDQIKSANLIACPGCYPTASQLALIPLLANNLIDADIVIDAKSGASGAGRKEAVANLYAEAGDSIKAYGVDGHRHLPEILQGLNQFSTKPLSLTFVPHLMPMIRGILITAYANLIDLDADLQTVFETYYEDEPFVDVLPAGMSPQTRSVKSSNMCQIAVSRPQSGTKAVILAVEDNLVKGAAGQAVQCMNLCCGLSETTGLDLIGLLP